MEESTQLPASRVLYFELGSSKTVFMVEGVHRLESVFKVAKTKHNIKLFFFALHFALHLEVNSELEQTNDVLTGARSRGVSASPCLGSPVNS